MTILCDPFAKPGILVWQIQSQPCWDLEEQSSLRPHSTDGQEENTWAEKEQKMSSGTGEEGEFGWTLHPG